jgi:hypothetical protein
VLSDHKLRCHCSSSNYHKYYTNFWNCLLFIATKCKYLRQISALAISHHGSKQGTFTVLFSLPQQGVLTYRFGIPLEQVRPSSSYNTTYWTTNSGTPVWNNNNSLTVGQRGPILLEDYHLVEKLAQFDRERIPERVVHARGASAKGFFEVSIKLFEHGACETSSHTSTYRSHMTSLT